MAKQAGPFFFTGTLGDVIFYKSGEQYLVRMKGSYNTKALQKPGARSLMQLRQQEFGQASKLASRVRRQLPLVKRKGVTIGSLTREARKLLREGRLHEDIIATLLIVCKGEMIRRNPAGETSRVIDTSVVKKTEEKGMAKVLPCEQTTTAMKPQPILKQSVTKKAVSIAYIPQHKQSTPLSDGSKHVSMNHKRRKLKWPSKAVIKLE